MHYTQQCIVCKNLYLVAYMALLRQTQHAQLVLALLGMQGQLGAVHPCDSNPEETQYAECPDLGMVDV